MTKPNVQKALDMLDKHYDAFRSTVAVAAETGHPVPIDTRAWSQILVSLLTGINGLNRKKGTDLKDGSDVKGALTWDAIDTPRFNGVIKAGTKAATAGTVASLDGMPFLFLVLWDKTAAGVERCRIWVVRTQRDRPFREICADWYARKAKKDKDPRKIKSNNFQLHPPRGRNDNILRNTCGNLAYPLYFHAERGANTGYKVKRYNPRALKRGTCRKVNVG